MDNLKNKTGVYLIKNLKNGRIYVGSSSKCLKHRLKHHFNSLKRNDHHSRFLQRDYNKNGDCFIYGILEFCNPDNCVSVEQVYLDNLKPDYNHSPTASSSLGVKHTKETIEKNRKAKLGIIPWNKGKKVGSFLTKDSIKKRKVSMIKNKTRAGKKPIRVSLSCNDKSISFLSLQYCADYIGVSVAYLSTKLKNKESINIRNFNLVRV